VITNHQIILKKYFIINSEVSSLLGESHSVPFNSINSDGSVSTCFLDWARKLIIGNANTQSVKSIWFGEGMKEYRKMFLEGGRKEHPVCKDCGQLTHGMPDNIDKYSEKLLKRLKG